MVGCVEGSGFIREKQMDDWMIDGCMCEWSYVWIDGWQEGLAGGWRVHEWGGGRITGGGKGEGKWWWWRIR